VLKVETDNITGIAASLTRTNCDNICWHP